MGIDIQQIRAAGHGMARPVGWLISSLATYLVA